jgi:hypothetical protein
MGWPVWGEEWVFFVMSYIDFSYLRILTRFWRHLDRKSIYQYCRRSTRTTLLIAHG